MTITYKVLINNKQIDFDKAVIEKKVMITKEGLQTSKDVKLLRNTELFDGNGEKIYENDILIDNEGNEYIVLFNCGNFIIKNMNNASGCTPFLLSAFKLNSIIETLFVK